MKTRTACCGHSVPSHPGRQRRACDECGAPLVPRPTRTCRRCGVEYAPTGVRQSYCSKRCQGADAAQRWRNGQPRDLRTCGKCGEMLAGNRRKWCSLDCMGAGAGAQRAEPLPARICALPECSTEFSPRKAAQRCCCEKHGKLLYNRESRADGRQKTGSPWTDRRRDAYHRRRAAKKATSSGEPVLLADIAERDA